VKKLGIIGARGYVGGELLRLLADHGGFELGAVSSRKLAGRKVRDEFDHPSELAIEALEPDDLTGRGLDVLVLALPNGLSEPWVEAVDCPIVDVSADHRFRDDWTYGLPEHFRDRIVGATKIANPGCYATGMQVAVRPLLDLLEGPVHVFGVSGYSGAGTKPSPKNDPEQLADNLMPYKLVGHTHEREVSRQLDHTVNFMPHVAPFFRGIALTISAQLQAGAELSDVTDRYRALAEAEPLVRWSEEAPFVRDAANRHEVTVGGVEFDPERQRLAVVATLDNLLKGAATQALQNLNLLCGFDELRGIRT
jgi:N-acetyl-gamma-glutamyl-phosphate reductase common form